MTNERDEIGALLQDIRETTLIRMETSAQVSVGLLDRMIDALAVDREVSPVTEPDPRKVAHIECDCVPDLGPAHCHLCSERAGREVSWAEAHPAATEPDTEKLLADIVERLMSESNLADRPGQMARLEAIGRDVESVLRGSRTEPAIEHPDDCLYALHDEGKPHHYEAPVIPENVWCCDHCDYPWPTGEGDPNMAKYARCSICGGDEWTFREKEPAPEIFPGTRAALDGLTIRPEVQP